MNNGGFRRRNTYILKALVESRNVTSVFTVKRVPRLNFLSYLKKRSNTSAIKDIFYFSLLPDRYFKKVNQKIAKFLISLQVKNSVWQSKDQIIIWSYWPQGFCDAIYLDLPGRWIFDTDHNIIDDPNLNTKDIPARVALLEYTIKRCDTIISSSRSMLDWYHKNGYFNTVLLMNGVDSERFKTSTSNQLSHISRPIIGYVGTLSSWINYDWFIRLIEENPQWNFVIVGKAYQATAHRKLENYKNVHLLGSKSAKEVPAIIKKFDVAIGLYKKQEGLDVNSMKLYEYLAAKIPVVVNDYHEFLEEDFADLIDVVCNYQDFVSQVQFYITNGYTPNCEKLNSFLEDSSWQNRVDNFIRSL